MRNLFVKLVAVAFIASIVGCNTMKGAGQDMEQTGKNIKETVEHND